MTTPNLASPPKSEEQTCREHGTPLQTFDLAKEYLGMDRYSYLVVRYCPNLLCQVYVCDKPYKIRKVTGTLGIQQPYDDLTLNVVIQLHILKKQIARNMVGDQR